MYIARENIPGRTAASCFTLHCNEMNLLWMNRKATGNWVKTIILKSQ